MSQATRSELTAAKAELEKRVQSLVSRNDALNLRLEKSNKNVSQLKFVARHYKRQRDQVDAYLSGVLDQISEKPTEEKFAPRPQNFDRVALNTMAVGPPVYVDDPGPRTNRPRCSDPESYDDDVYSLGLGRDRIHWEDY